MEILVISACSGSKEFDEQKLDYEDFASENLDEKEEELSHYQLAAKDMYTGREHGYTEEAVQNLQNVASVDWKIISAGYGCIEHDEEIVPYEVTFNQDEIDTKEWAREIGIPDDFANSINGYDMVVVALGTEYLKALDLKNQNIPEGPRIVFLTGKTGRRHIPAQGNIEIIDVGSEQQKKYGKMMISLKGWLLKEYASNVEGTSSIENFSEDFYNRIDESKKSSQSTLEDM